MRMAELKLALLNAQTLSFGHYPGTLRACRASKERARLYGVIFSRPPSHAAATNVVLVRKPNSGCVLTDGCAWRIISFVVILMKTGRYLAMLSLLLLLGGPSAGARQSKNNPNTQVPPAQSPSQDQMAAHAEAYYDFVMGHYFAQEYQVSSHGEDANKAIDFLKKAFTLDPASQQIGDELAEIYYQSQRIRDAVVEANSILAKDPDNLTARRLLARISVRTPGHFTNPSRQKASPLSPPDQSRTTL